MEVATAAEGLAVSLPPGRLAGVASVQVHFDHQRATPRRSVHVTAVTIAGERLDIDDFLARHEIAAEELGAWMRSAVERALDAASAGRG